MLGDGISDFTTLYEEAWLKKISGICYELKKRKRGEVLPNVNCEAIMLEEKILNEYKTVALVGVSPNPKQASCRVARYLDKHGYEVIPVNPHAQEILGKTSYPNLSTITEAVEVVDIFRSSEQVMPIVDEAIKIGAKAVWMQEGVINEQAASKARDAGLLVVMDKCMRKEHLRLQRKQRPPRPC